MIYSLSLGHKLRDGAVDRDEGTGRSKQGQNHKGLLCHETDMFKFISNH